MFAPTDVSFLCFPKTEPNLSVRDVLCESDALTLWLRAVVSQVLAQVAESGIWHRVAIGGNRSVNGLQLGLRMWISRV